MSSPIARDRDSGYHRVEAFSDAVIAIIMTLIAYDLMQTGDHRHGQLVRELLAAWPSYLAFLMSFLVIGQMWVVHHNLWQMVRTADQGLLVLNLALLLFIAVLPWAAKLLATHLDGDDAELRLAATIYAAVALGQAIFFNAMLYWGRARGLFDSEMDDARFRVVRRRFIVGPVVYTIALAVSFFAPLVSFAAYVAAALLYLCMGFLHPSEHAGP
jgi:uncharacterized membrane protein